MVKTYKVTASSETHSSIASFLVAEQYNFAFSKGEFMIEVIDDDESRDRFDSLLTFFVATAVEIQEHNEK